MSLSPNRDLWFKPGRPVSLGQFTLDRNLGFNSMYHSFGAGQRCGYEFKLGTTSKVVGGHESILDVHQRVRDPTKNHADERWHQTSTRSL